MQKRSELITFAGVAVIERGKGKYDFRFHTTGQKPADGKIGIWMNLPGTATFSWAAMPEGINSRLDAAQSLLKTRGHFATVEVKNFLQEEVKKLQSAQEALNAPKKTPGRPKVVVEPKEVPVQPSINDMQKQVRGMARLLKKAGIELPPADKVEDETKKAA